MDEGGFIMSSFLNNDEFYQRIHKYNKNTRALRKMFRKILKRDKEFSVDLARLTIPPNDPEYTRKCKQNKEDFAVIAHIYQKIIDYPHFTGIVHTPTNNNRAHHDIKFEENIAEDKISEIADYIVNNKCFEWKIPLN